MMVPKLLTFGLTPAEAMLDSHCSALVMLPDFAHASMTALIGTTVGWTPTSIIRLIHRSASSASPIREHALIIVVYVTTVGFRPASSSLESHSWALVMFFARAHASM